MHRRLSLFLVILVSACGDDTTEVGSADADGASDVVADDGFFEAVLCCYDVIAFGSQHCFGGTPDG